MARETFLGAAGAIPPVVEAVAADWERPSALEGWTVGGLAGHFARAISTVVRYLDAAAPSGGTVVDAAGYFLYLDTEDPALARGVLERGIEAGAAGPEAVARRAREDLVSVTTAVEGAAATRQVSVFGGLVMSLDEYLRTRLVEIVVHHDDLVASVGRPLPALDDRAVEEALAVLVEMAERRHGAMPLVRALTRRERSGPINVL